MALWEPWQPREQNKTLLCHEGRLPGAHNNHPSVHTCLRAGDVSLAARDQSFPTRMHPRGLAHQVSPPALTGTKEED